MKHKYTYTRQMAARLVRGGCVIVPDCVAADQRAYDGRVFPALPASRFGNPVTAGKKVRVKLRGDLYGLNTPGTGDMVVARV